MASMLQDTDGSGRHLWQFFSKKRYCAASAIDIERHLRRCSRLFFEKLAMAAGSFERQTFRFFSIDEQPVRFDVAVARSFP